MIDLRDDEDQWAEFLRLSKQGRDASNKAKETAEFESYQPADSNDPGVMITMKLPDVDTQQVTVYERITTALDKLTDKISGLFAKPEKQVVVKTVERDEKGLIKSIKEEKQ